MPPLPATLRLLYVDPGEEAAVALAQALGEAGLDVTRVADAARARDVLGTQDVDVVLLGIDGAGGPAGEPLSSLLGQGEMPPLVRMVEPHRPQDAAEALEAGADICFVREPGPEFIRLLVAILERSVSNDRALLAAHMTRAEAAEAGQRADVLLNEMKHRIANSLALVVSMAHMQAGSLENAEARRVMDAFADRVHSFAQVHKGLYASMKIGTVALDSYLGGLARELHRNHVDRKSVTRVIFECVPASVSVDQAISLGVILSEWVSNAARFAYPGPLKGEVRASLRRVSGERAVLTVEDDGIGIVRNTTPQAGLGSQIVGVLAHGLGGWFELKPRDQGMVATLHFPLPEAVRGSGEETSKY